VKKRAVEERGGNRTVDGKDPAAHKSQAISCDPPPSAKRANMCPHGLAQRLNPLGWWRLCRILASPPLVSPSQAPLESESSMVKVDSYQQSMIPIFRDSGTYRFLTRELNRLPQNERKYPPQSASKQNMLKEDAYQQLTGPVLHDSGSCRNPPSPSEKKHPGGCHCV
jgi:hypothetical protein